MRLEARVELSETLKHLEGVGARAADLTPVWLGKVRPRMLEAFEKQFTSEGAYFGSPWAPLAPMTLKLRERPGHGQGGTLWDTGRLHDAFVLPGPEHIEHADRNSFTLGASVPYAEQQQQGFVLDQIFGHAVSPRAVPARPIVTDILPMGLMDAIKNDLAAYVVEGTL